MRSRAWLVAAASLVVAGVAACSSGGTAAIPSISIIPAGTVDVFGPTLFTVARVNTDSPVTWTLTGAGSISSTTGGSTTYSPPALGATGTASLTAATADGLSSTVMLNIAPPQETAGTLPGLSAAVQISYDAYDIPHVTCAAINDCLETQGYLQARDRLFQMDLFRRTARGQLASLIGALEVSSDEEFLTFFTTRDGQRIEDELVANLDSDTAGKVGAFVNGINAYISELKRNPGEPLPAEYSQMPFPLTAADIPLWTAQDTLAIGRLQQFQLSETIEEETGYSMFAGAFGPGGPLANSGLMNAWVRDQETERSYTLPNVNAAAHPPRQANPLAHAMSLLAGYQSVLKGAKANVAHAKALLGDLGVDTGSNNWAVDAAHSATGQAMVANDPHLSLQYPPLFHLIAMTATDNSGLDLQGGSFPGIPGALIGRGKHVGWGDTVVGYDVTDLYAEQVGPCGASPAGCTSFNGAANPLLPVQLSIAVRGGTAVPFVVLVNPQHGPFIQFDPTSGKGISMRWTGHEVTNDIRAFVNLNLATGVGSVTDVGTSNKTGFAALHDMATGAQNFVMADDQGNIGYDPHGLVPKRPWITEEGPYPWFLLPGDGSAEWGSGNAADHCAGTGANPPSANCWYADADLPHADASNTSTSGFLVTANSDPAGYGDLGNNFPVSVRNGAPFYLSFDWDDPTGYRHAEITKRLTALTANSGKVAVSDMQSVQTDHTSLLASSFIPVIDLIAAGAPANTLPPQFTAAQTMLDAWAASANTSPLNCPTGLTGSSVASAVTTNATDLANSNSCFLFHVFLRMLLNNVFDDELSVAGLGLDSSNSIRGMVYILQQAVHGALTQTTPIDQDFCNTVDSTGTVIAQTGCFTQVVTALATAYGTLAALRGTDSTKWIWGQTHTLTTTSPASPIVDGTFGAGPFARPGGAITVDVGNPDFSSTADPLAFPYSSGSNLRMVAEMNPAAANTKMQLPGPERDGQQGVFASSPDLIGQYVTNTYFDFAWSAQIAQSVVSTQTFNPQAAQ